MRPGVGSGAVPVVEHQLRRRCKGRVTCRWVTRALTVIVALLGSWNVEAAIRTGDVVSDLSKPFSYLGFWLARDYGRVLSLLLYTIRPDISGRPAHFRSRLARVAADLAGDGHRRDPDRRGMRRLALFEQSERVPDSRPTWTRGAGHVARARAQGLRRAGSF